MENENKAITKEVVTMLQKYGHFKHDSSEM